MKNVLNARRIAVAGLASFGLMAITPAFANSELVSGGGNLAANADLKFQVVIPRFIDFTVGSAGTTVDEVHFDVDAADVGNGTEVARTNGGGAAIDVSLRSNVGNIALSADSATTGLVGTGGTIDWDKISGTSSNAAELPVPAVAAAASTLNATDGVIDADAKWTFAYANDATIGAGTYIGTVTYTAASL